MKTPREQLGGDPTCLRDLAQASALTAMEYDPAFTAYVLLYPFGGSIEKCTVGPDFSVVVGNADHLGALDECEAFLVENWPEATRKELP